MIPPAQKAMINLQVDDLDGVLDRFIDDEGVRVDPKLEGRLRKVRLDHRPGRKSRRALTAYPQEAMLSRPRLLLITPLFSANPQHNRAACADGTDGAVPATEGTKFRGRPQSGRDVEARRRSAQTPRVDQDRRTRQRRSAFTHCRSIQASRSPPDVRGRLTLTIRWSCFGRTKGYGARPSS